MLRYDHDIIFVDTYAKIRTQEIFMPTISKHSLYASTNENGNMMIDFAKENFSNSTYFQ